MPVLFYNHWNFAQKFAFRFFFSFFLIYILPFPFDSVPFTAELTSLSTKLTGWYFAIFDAYTNAWHNIIPWVGTHILGQANPIKIFTNGSGDTTYDYVLALTFLFLALLASVIWSVFDRHRKSYHIAYYWLRVLLRYYLAANMLGYGFIKVFHLQMPFPDLATLSQPFGDKSPMGLAWSFVGYSKGFSAFTGLGEVVGGLLLFFRRTTTLGALLATVVIGNIVAINFCYDVPVKLFSSVLWLMAVFLILPDLRALWNMFLLSRTAHPVDMSISLAKNWQGATRLILKWVFIIYVVYSNISGSLKSEKEYGDSRIKSSLYGIYNTVIVIRNKDTLQPLTTDTTRWKQLIIPYEKFGQIRLMNDSAQWYSIIEDTTKHSLTLFKNSDTLHKSIFRYEKEGDFLTLSGNENKDSIFMRLRKIDIRSFRLVSRGFHWINEYPYNR